MCLDRIARCPRHADAERSHVKSGAGSTFVIRTLRDDLDGLTVGGLDPHVLANWHLQMLDSDYY